MADNITLSEEEVTALKEAAAVACQEAIAAYVAMTPEQQAAHESAVKASSAAANEAYTVASLAALAAMADARPGLHL